MHMFGYGNSLLLVLAKMFIKIAIMCHSIACIIRLTARIEMDFYDKTNTWV